MILDVKKASLDLKEADKTTQIKVKEELNDLKPTDRFYYVHILFTALGLMHFIPYSFFLTANAYWMYKFRNVSADITDTDARTALQTHFSAGSTISNIIPAVVFMLGSTIYGYKIKARIRVLVALSIFTSCFIFMTIFIKTNTDSWQLEFFILTMATLVIVSGANSVLDIATLAILSKCPQSCMKVYMIGQSLAGIFNAVLQIISLAIGTSTTTSALIYFLVGSILMTLSTIMFFFSKQNKWYNWYINSIAEDTKRAVISFATAKSLAKTLWPCIMMLCLIMLTTFPSTLQSHRWSFKNTTDRGIFGTIYLYFVPVVTFLYADVVGMLGKVISSKINKSINKYVLTAFMFVNMVIFVPLTFFCNAQPRTHSEVILPHDL